jgi:hypothetical protein
MSWCSHWDISWQTRTGIPGRQDLVREAHDFEDSDEAGDAMKSVHVRQRVVLHDVAVSEPC